MTKYQLIWWIFAYLHKNHKSVLEDMLENFYEDKWSSEAKHTRKQSLNDAYREFKPDED